MTSSKEADTDEEIQCERSSRTFNLCIMMAIVVRAESDKRQ